MDIGAHRPQPPPEYLDSPPLLSTFGTSRQPVSPSETPAKSLIGLKIPGVVCTSEHLGKACPRLQPGSRRMGPWFGLTA